MRRIRALVKPARVGPAAVGKSAARPWPVTQRFLLVDRRADERARVGANDRARDRAMHVAGDRGSDDRAGGSAPAGPSPGGCVAGSESERAQQES